METEAKSDAVEALDPVISQVNNIEVSPKVADTKSTPPPAKPLSIPRHMPSRRARMEAKTTFGDRAKVFDEL